ncbi:clasp N terminal-domain-containing protein [Aspergillus cavernicola]|uniref:Clasp N terminal-domain-containing protein n=1 Tax=Aspergillus cavernicola TaxID=176166 RepID=A0ABR4IBA4_9EURO
MEPKAVELVAVLKNGNLAIDVKVAHLLGLKSDIKQKNVPEGAVTPIFQCLRLAIASPHVALLAAGFSTLGHCLKRLFIQEQHSLVALHAHDLYPSLLERLGDHKERLRAQAAQAFTDLWPAANAEVEHCVLELALTGKNPKAREMSLVWLSAMNHTPNFLFRSYVPGVVACLEDADGAVRDTAKSTVIELFENAPPHAKSDLRRQLVANNVRKSIANHILAGIGLDEDLPASQVENILHRPASRAAIQSSRPPSRGDALHNRPNRPPSRGDALHNRPPSRGDALHNRPSRPPSRGDALHQKNASRMAEASQPTTPVVVKPVAVRPRPTTAMKTDQERAPRAVGASSPQKEDEVPAAIFDVQPRDVVSARDFQDLVREMAPSFQGRETEDNWAKRVEHTHMLRRLTHGNAPIEYTKVYVDTIKSLLPSIFLAAHSLRTMLSTSGCLMLQDMARICESRIDPMIDVIMPNLMKLCTSTKKIAAENGNLTVQFVLENATCNSRLITHVTSAAQEKNVQLRVFGAGWLKIVIRRHNLKRYKGTTELLLNIEACIKKSLLDPSPVVREAVRSTYWTFHGVRPDNATKILSHLDEKSRSLLEKDPSNPNFDPFAVSNSTPSKTGIFSNTSATPGHLNLKEAIVVEKKPSLAPTKSGFTTTGAAPSALPDAAATDHRKTHISRAVPMGSHTSSLTSAPMRPGVAKSRPAPLDVARPATATGLPPKAIESPTPGSPSRILVAQPATPSTRQLGATRPRQKSDPLQDASPTKMRKLVDHRGSLGDLPYGSIHIPKRRSNTSETASEISEQVNEKKADENNVPRSVSVDTEAHPVPNRHTLPESPKIKEVPASQAGETDHLVLDETMADVRLDEAPLLDFDNHAPADGGSLSPPDDIAPAEGASLAQPDDIAQAEGGSQPDDIIQAEGGSFVQVDDMPVTRISKVPRLRFDDIPVLQIERPRKPSNWAKRVATPPKRRNISSRWKDPAQARGLLVKGIERIRARSMDILGYRLLQGLIEYHDSLFVDEEQFDFLLMALFSELRIPPKHKHVPASAEWDVQTQILATVRHMFYYAKKYFSAYHEIALVSLLRAQKHYYGLANLFVTALQELIFDIIAESDPVAIINTVVDALDLEDTQDHGLKQLLAGLEILSRTVELVNDTKLKTPAVIENNDTQLGLPADTIERLGTFASFAMTIQVTDVRKAVTALTTELRPLTTNQEHFWTILGFRSETDNRVVSYYSVKGGNDQL